MTQSSLRAALTLRASRLGRSVPNASRLVEPEGSHEASLIPINDKARTKRALTFMAEKEGFEPSKPFGLHTFQACAFDHSATSPEGAKSTTRISVLGLLSRQSFEGNG